MRSPWMALADGFADIEANLARLDDDAFALDAREDPEGPGAAVRRCLAQFDALELGLRTRWVPDTTRVAWPLTTCDRRAAMHAARHATWRALSLHGVAPDAPVNVETSFEPGTSPLVVPSSAGRELALLVRQVRAVAAALHDSRRAAEASFPAAETLLTASAVSGAR